MNWVSIGSGNGLSPAQCHAITWSNAYSLSIGPLETNFGDIWIELQNFLFVKMHLKMLSVKWWPFCSGGRWVNSLNPGKMPSNNLVNTGLDDGSYACASSLHETMLTYHQWSPFSTKPLPKPLLQYWLTIIEIVTFTWGQFHRNCSTYLSLISIWKWLFMITATSPRGQWVNSLRPSDAYMHQ